MEVAVFSDIHGNYVAFQSCLEYALKRNINTFILLGDYLGEFPYPQKTMELLYSMQNKYQCFFIRGNKEDYWINHRNSDIEWKSGTSSTGALSYCFSNLKDKDIEFFSKLSVSGEIKIEGHEPILACHGSPNSNREKLLPDNENTKITLKNCTQKYILCGHTHIQEVIEYNGKAVLNPGAVGVSLHSNGRAQFMVLHSNDKEWDYEFISMDYDKERVIKEMRESGLMELAPYWNQITVHLMLTGELSHGTVLSKAMEYCKKDTGNCIWYDIPEIYWEKAIREFIDFG